MSSQDHSTDIPAVLPATSSSLLPQRLLQRSSSSLGSRSATATELMDDEERQELRDRVLRLAKLRGS